MIISCRKLLYLSSLFFYLIISRMAQNLIAGQSLALDNGEQIVASPDPHANAPHAELVVLPCAAALHVSAEGGGMH